MASSTFKPGDRVRFIYPPEFAPVLGVVVTLEQACEIEPARWRMGQGYSGHVLVCLDRPVWRARTWQTSPSYLRKADGLLDI